MLSKEALDKAKDVGLEYVEQSKQKAAEQVKASVIKTRDYTPPKPGSGPTSYQKKLIKGGSSLMTAANVFVMGTALLDFGMQAADRRERNNQVKQQEENLKDKQKREKEARRRAHNRDSINGIRPKEMAGQMVMDMFNNRTGHHKMGNSRF